MINLDVQSALERVGAKVHAQIIAGIEDPDRWEYRDPQTGAPRETKRKNSEVVTSPRNIVDLGTLRDSQNYAVVDGTLKFYNTAEHSALVHEGGSNGKSQIPPRRFISEVIDSLDIKQMVADELGARLAVDARGRTTLKDSRGRFRPYKGIGDVDAEGEVTNFDY